MTWTEYRRAPLVPAAHYLSELIYAYRSLSRIPIINPDYNDPKEERRPIVGRYGWITQRVSRVCQSIVFPVLKSVQEYESQDTLINLYQEFGWPDQWRRAEFLAKWETKREEIVMDPLRSRERLLHSIGNPPRRTTTIELSMP